MAIEKSGSRVALKDIAEAELFVDRKSAAKVSDLLAELPLKLPIQNQYYLELKGGVLTITGAKFGIERFSFVSGALPEDQAIDSDGVTISFRSNPSITVRLLRNPAAIPATAVGIDEQGAPVEQILRYADLYRDSRGSAASIAERRALLEEIKSHLRSVSPATRTSARSTPTSSGESRGSTYSRGPG